MEGRGTPSPPISMYLINLPPSFPHVLSLSLFMLVADSKLSSSFLKHKLNSPSSLEREENSQS